MYTHSISYGERQINEHLCSNPDLSKAIICIKFAVLLLVNFSDIYVRHIGKPYEITVSWTTTEVWYTMTSFYIQLMALMIIYYQLHYNIYQLISYTLPIHFKDNPESRKYNVHVDILHPKTAHVSEVDLNFMYWEIDFFFSSMIFTQCISQQQYPMSISEIWLVHH